MRMHFHRMWYKLGLIQTSRNKERGTNQLTIIQISFTDKKCPLTNYKIYKIAKTKLENVICVMSCQFLLSLIIHLLWSVLIARVLS